MGISKLQKQRVSITCACGCGEIFLAFPVYRNKTDGGGLRVPEYKRGHHPNTRKNQTGVVPPWNRGLIKTDHPSISRMGFQSGHQPYNDWSHVNQLLASDFEVRKKWLLAKQGQVAWNTGMKKSAYPNGIASGPAHGNWKGGHGGFRDTAEWQDLRKSIHRRDNWTCQACGDRNHKGRGSRIRLDTHHIIAVCEAPELVKEPNNLITLCKPCHAKTHNYGFKAVKKRSGN